jgi:hypothetical protein
MGLGMGIPRFSGGGVNPIIASGADLALWFDENQAYKSIGGGVVTPDSILTYTAPSPKMVYGSDGVLRYAPHNLLTYSEDINQGQWTVTNITINSSTQFTFTTAAGYFRRSLLLSPNSRYELIVELSGSHPGDTFRLELVDAVDGSDSSFVDVTVPASSTEFTVAADMTVATFSGSLLVAINRTSAGRSITAGSTVNITKIQLRRAPAHAGYVPTTAAAVYSLPRNHNPVTGAALGVLVEEARTNLLTYSEQFDNADWTKNATTVTANAVVSPDGVTSADKVLENGTTGTHWIFQSKTTTAVATTFSVYMKAAERSWGMMRLRDSATNDRYAWFNLSTGAVGTVQTNLTASMTDVGNGWYRCVATISAAVAGTNPCVAGPASADNTVSYTGVLGDGIYLWGAQLEAGAFATSYIPTTNNPLGVTRAADNISILTSAFPYSATAGTLYAEVGTPPSGARIAGGGSTQGFVAGLTIGAAVNNISGVFFNTTTWVFGVSNAGDSSVAFNGALDTHKIAWSFTPGGVDMQGAAYGTLAGTLCTNTPSSSASLRLGSRNSAGDRMLCGHIKRLDYYASRKTDAELQVLST